MVTARTTNHSRRRRSRALLLVGLAAAGLTAWLSQRSSDFGRPTGRANQTASIEDLRHLQQLAEQPEQGLHGLAQALTSKQDTIRGTAQRILLNQLTAWEQLPPDDAAGKMGLLAAALGTHVSDYDDRVCAAAAEMALRMLSWRVQTHASGCSQMVADCDRVLRTASARAKRALSRRDATDHQPHRIDTPPETRSAEDLIATSNEPNVLDFGRQLDLPGGGLPLETGQPPSEEGSTPGPLNPSPHAKPLPSESDHFGRRSPSGRDITAEEPGGLMTSDNRSKKPLRQPEAIVTRTAAEVPDDGDDNGDTVRLMRDLHDPDLQVAKQAATRLTQRGFGPTQLELARQMTSADPAVRQQVAEILPRVPGIDAEIWLIWLSRDEDPQVRLAAMTVMATTGDPAILKRLAQMARDDTDPRIREQGERLTSGQSNRR
jgi:hypothetical protein